jgi:hypothetical protein
MKSSLDFRNPDLWAGKTGDSIWRAFKTDLDQRIGRTFVPGRQNAIVDIRESLIQRPDRFELSLQ